MNSKNLSLGLCALTLTAVTLYPVVQSHDALPMPTLPPPQFPPGKVLSQARPRIDVVFVLDTTGSMSGLLQSAKDKIWSLATTMAQAQPAPEIRVGLVAYRDRGDAYITQTFDLTSDLDSMYATLMDFQAAGGGDGPEAVNQALHDAVTKLAWSPAQNAYKVVFLVGDAPPHMDYQDDVKYPVTLALARQKGIVVNTIQCGEDGSATPPWQQIASLGDGNFLQVAQGGSAVAITTPFDDKLARLAANLDETRLYYGNQEKRAEKQRKMEATSKLEASASVAAKARRATFNATASGTANLLGDSELVDDVARGRVDLSKINQAELPAPLQAMAPAAQASYLQAQAVKRDALKREIKVAADERAAYLKEKVAAEGGARASLDQQLFGTVRAQAEKKGLRYEADAPAY